MISVYHSAFNLNKHGFTAWDECLKRSCIFADEVVVAVNESQDDTLEIVKKILSRNAKKSKIIETNFSYQDPWLDGKIKNAALQECTQEFKIQLDLDEYIPERQRFLWNNLCFRLKFDTAQCYAVGSVDLYKDMNHFKSINHKQYLHKKQAYRAPQLSARNPDGTINTKISDGCDLVDKDGNFILTSAIPKDLSLLEEDSVPFVVHLGYVDLFSRLKRNHEFWNEHWYTESGGKAPAHKIHLKEEDFNYPYIEHKLKL